MLRTQAIELIEAELDRYHTLWGRPDGEWPDHRDKKNRILVEEVGEISKALNERDEEGLPKELVQTAAVCIAWLMADH